MKKFFAVLGMLALGGVAIISGVLFYQLRSRQITPTTPEESSAAAEGIIWNEAIDCNGGRVSLSTIPDWQSILRVAEVTPNQWTWGADTTKTVQGRIGWLFPGDNQVFEERPSKTYTKPANCGAAITVPTPTPVATPKASVTPTPTQVALIQQQQVAATPTLTPTSTPTPAATQPPSLGGLGTPTPTPTPTSTASTQIATGGTTTTTTTAVGGGTSGTPFPIPVTGGEVPTILAIGGGILLLIFAVVFAL